MKKFCLSAVLLLCLSLPGSAEPTLYERELERWHQKRIENLTKPDGYLSLVGLEWLSSEAKEIPGVGLAKLEGEEIILMLQEGFQLQGQPVTELRLDTTRPEAEERVEKGSLSFYAVKRGHLTGLRFKDSQAPTRVNFQGVERFETDPGYVVQGRLVLEAGDIEVASVVGATTVEKSPGWAEFQWQDQTYRARLVGEPEDETFFMVFSDATAGDSTYSACRFLYVDRIQDDILSLDFNKSINPACAFTHYATCPLPPQENIFPFPIPVGEKAP